MNLWNFSSDTPPRGLKWRSNTTFIIATVAIGLFTDLFLYGLIVPILPFMLRNRIDIPQDKVQSYTSGLLAAYAGASVLFSIPAGWIADKTGARQTPFLVLVSGALRDSIGYGNMNLVLAVVVGITAILAFVFVGGGIGKRS
ncbi:hypothetical protein Vi05172_g12145 [Venturia inaequalis]|nr:hypothetical protein Vi05172_g12145 [Venturia inaequalis]